MRPRRNVDILPLREHMIFEQWLYMFPTIQCANVSKGCRYDIVEAISRCIAKDRSFHMSRFHFTTVHFDVALGRDNSLCHIETGVISLSEPEDDVDLGIARCGTDTLHLRRVDLQRIADVLNKQRRVDRVLPNPRWVAWQLDNRIGTYRGSSIPETRPGQHHCLR